MASGSEEPPDLGGEQAAARVTSVYDQDTRPPEPTPAGPESSPAAADSAALPDTDHSHPPSDAEPAAPASAAVPPRNLTDVCPPVIGDPGSQLEFISQLATAWPGRADTAIDAGITGALDVRAASIRGKSHRDKRDSPFSTTRQDEYCFQLTADGRWLVVVVADGVSSGDESHVAATIVARRGCSTVANMLDEGTAVEDIAWTEVAGLLSTVIVREWLKRRPEPFDPEDFAAKTAEEADELRRRCAVDCATTALAAVVSTQLESDATVAFTGVVLAGDSSLWLLEPDTGWRALSKVKNEDAEIASNVTSGLPIVGDVETHVERIAPGAALFLMSDGLGDPLGGGSGEVGRYLAEHWQRPPSGYAFAATLDFYRRTFDDDRTAVGIWLADETEP